MLSLRKFQLVALEIHDTSDIEEVTTEAILRGKASESEYRDPTKSPFLIDLPHENIMTSAAMIIHPPSKTYPIDFRDLHISFNENPVSVTLPNVANPFTANSFKPSVTNAACFRIPFEDYDFSASVQYNRVRFQDSSTIRDVFSLSEYPTRAVVEETLKFITSRQEAGYTFNDGEYPIVEESTKVTTIVIKDYFSEKIYPQGFIILCEKLQLSGPFQASSEDVSPYPHRGRLNIPIILSSNTNEIITFNLLTVPLIRPGLPSTEIEVDREGELRMQTSLHIGINNTRTYDLVSPIRQKQVLSEDLHPDDTNIGVLIQHLSSMRALTPLCLRIYIPYVGLHAAFAPPDSVEKHLYTYTGGISRITLDLDVILRPISIVDITSPGPTGSALPTLTHHALGTESSLLFQAVRVFATPVPLDFIGSILTTIEFVFTPPLELDPRDRITIIIPDLVLQRMSGSVLANVPMLRKMITTFSHYPIPCIAEFKSLTPFLISHPHLTIPSLAPTSTYAEVFTRTAARNPGVAGSLAPLVISTALPAVFTSQFPAPEACATRVYLQLPVPRGIISDFSALFPYSNFPTGATPSLACELYRIRLPVDFSDHPTRTVLQRFTTRSVGSHPGAYWRILLPRMIQLPSVESSSSGVSFALQCHAPSLFTKNYEIQTLDSIFFYMPLACSTEFPQRDGDEKWGAFSVGAVPVPSSSVYTSPLSLPPITVPLITAHALIEPAKVGPNTVRIVVPTLPAFFSFDDVIEISFPLSHGHHIETKDDVQCSIVRDEVGGTVLTTLSFNENFILPIKMSASGTFTKSLATKLTTLRITMLRDIASQDVLHLPTVPAASFTTIPLDEDLKPTTISCFNIVYTSAVPEDSSFSFILRSAPILADSLFPYAAVRPLNSPLWGLSGGVKFPPVFMGIIVNGLVSFSRERTQESTASFPSKEELGSFYFSFTRLEFPRFGKPAPTASAFALRIELPSGCRTIQYTSELISTSMCQAKVHAASPLSRPFALQSKITSVSPLLPQAQHTLLIEFPSSIEMYFQSLGEDKGYVIEQTTISCEGIGLPLSAPLSSPFIISALTSPSWVSGGGVIFVRQSFPLSHRYMATIGTTSLNSATLSFVPPLAGLPTTLVYTIGPIRVATSWFELTIELPPGMNRDSDGKPIPSNARCSISVIMGSSGEVVELVKNIAGTRLALTDPNPLFYPFTYASMAPGGGGGGSNPSPVSPDDVLRVPSQAFHYSLDAATLVVNGIARGFLPSDSLRISISGYRAPLHVLEAGETPLRVEIRTSNDPFGPVYSGAAREYIRIGATEDSTGRMALRRVAADPQRGLFAAFASPTDTQGFDGFPRSGGRIIFSLPPTLSFVSPELVECTISNHPGEEVRGYHPESRENLDPRSIFPVSFSLSSFQKDEEKESEVESVPTDRNIHESTQGARHRVSIEVSGAIATALAQTKYIFGIEIQCSGATPIAVELVPEDNHYMEIFTAISKQDGETEYISLVSALDALFTSERAPVLSFAPEFAQSSRFGGDTGTLELELRDLTTPIRIRDVVEIVFPHASLYHFGPDSTCVLSRILTKVSTQDSSVVVNEVLPLEQSQVRMSFSSTSLIRSTTAASASQAEGVVTSPQPQVVSLRFPPNDTDNNENENSDNDEDRVIFYQGEGLSWRCNNVVFPSAFTTTETLPRLEVSLYHSLSQRVSGFLRSLDTLLVRTAFNDDIYIPIMVPQTPRKIVFHTSSPRTEAKARIAIEIALTEAIKLKSQERQVVLVAEMPIGWRLSSTTDCVLSIGSPYFEDANVRGNTVFLFTNAQAEREKDKLNPKVDVGVKMITQTKGKTESEEKNNDIHENDALPLDSLEFTFITPKGMLSERSTLYLFCSNVEMPREETGSVTLSPNVNVSSTKQSSDMVNDIDSLILSDSATVLQYQTQACSVTLALEKQLKNILAQAHIASIPRVFSKEPEYSRVISLQHSFVSVRPFLESEIEEWKAMVFKIYGFQRDSIYREDKEYTNDSPNDILFRFDTGLSMTGINRASSRSGDIIGIRTLLQRSIPVNSTLENNSADQPNTYMTVFGARNYVPINHYQVELSVFIFPPQPWFPVERMWDTVFQNPELIVLANTTFARHYNAGRFESKISLDVSLTSCFNGYLDENETDVDCGGLECAKCHVGKNCAQASDCVSGVCGNAGVCVDTFSAAGGFEGFSLYMGLGLPFLTFLCLSMFSNLL